MNTIEVGKGVYVKLGNGTDNGGACILFAYVVHIEQTPNFKKVWFKYNDFGYGCGIVKESHGGRYTNHNVHYLECTSAIYYGSNVPESIGQDKNVPNSRMVVMGIDSNRKVNAKIVDLIVNEKEPEL